MQIYEHRQLATTILLFLGAGLVLTLFVLANMPESSADAWVPPALVAAMLSLALILLHSLCVKVTTEEVRIFFGPGWIGRRIRIEDILAARAVRNPWYVGWGIKRMPRGWLFSVSGLDAVELELRGDRRFRIGTDDVQRLLMAIENAREHGRRREEPPRREGH